ncbi:tetratricopeptide repeat protein [Aliinostoc sp. HNIBRCY26]|uniref:tetratricopeptide repeat protein n=1 Tax=Aliinostoc sp. HNIBRCY26 TaxID=3418997 RepID=UPI003D0327F9
MTCCLNPSCYNPFHPDGTKFCSNCGVLLVVLRNRYRPIKSLGGGGFGKTYLAEDIDRLNQQCVIKQFAPQIQGTHALKKATELFEQEARRLEQLGEHPQIPRLLAYFQEDSRLYLVQEFIDGQNLLTELEQQGNFSEQKIRELLNDLLEILKIVHQQKVIHRDIKPENIIRRESDRKLVLIDFGASKQVTKTVVSQQGTSIGSFGYVPMEQMKAGEAYPASDLYSLGATCFHLLSGSHPWELWQSEAYGWVTNWRQHLKTPVSQELGRILDKLLQQDYRERYQSVAEVLQDLNSPPPATKPPEIHQINTSAIPPKKPIPIKLLLPLILIPLGVGATYFNGVTQNSTTDNSGTIENSDTRSSSSTQEAETYKRQGLEKYEKQDFRGAIADYTQAITISPNDGEAYYERGINYSNSGENQKAIEDFRQAANLFTAQQKPGDAKRSQGLVLELSEDYQGAIAAYTEAIRLNLNDFRAYNNRGNAHSASGDRQAAIRDYTQAITINPNFAPAYNNRGTVHADLGDRQAAIRDYAQAITVNPNYAPAYNNRGNAHNALGDQQAAINDYTQAIRINPQYADAYYNRGIVHSDLGDKQAAIRDYTQAIRINPQYADAYYSRGNIHYQSQDNQAAFTDYNQAITINSKYVLAYIGRGNARTNLGDKQAAIKDYTQAINIDGKNALAYNNRGIAHSNLGDKQAAISDFRQAADLYRQEGKENEYQKVINLIQKLE